MLCGSAVALLALHVLIEQLIMCLKCKLFNIKFVY